MPETLQTPTAPVIRTSGAPTQPAHTAPAPQAAAGGMHTAVQITLSCEIASMQLTPTFKMGALQLRPISKVVTMRLASSPQQQQQAAMNLQANFEIAKIQSVPGSLGQLRLHPSQQQRPATLATPSFNISGMQLVSGFDSAPLQLTPSQQTQDIGASHRRLSDHERGIFSRLRDRRHYSQFELEDGCCAIARRKRFVRRKCTDVRNNERADGEQWRDCDAATESGSETRLTFPTKTTWGPRGAIPRGFLFSLEQSCPV